MKQFFSPEPVIITTGGGGPGLFHDTLKNMKKAVSLGSDAVRTNVTVTSDDKAVLFSNAVFQCKDVTEQNLSSYSLDEFKTVLRSDAGSSGRDGQDDYEGLLPGLEETLSAMKNHRFNLHLIEKDPRLIDRLCGIIRNLNAEDRILVSSLNGYNLKKIRSVFPDMATGFSFSGVMAFYALYRSGMIFFKKKFRDDALIIHEMIGASFLANAGLIGEAKSRGIRVYVLNIMKEEQVKRLNEAGVNGFVTNYASMVKRSLPIQRDTHDS